MSKSNKKTQTIQKMFSYNYKNKLSDEIQKNLIISRNNKYIPLISFPSNNNLDIIDSDKSESLSNLRKYIKTLKPFVLSNKIRKKMKYLKSVQKEDLDNFYSSSIRSSSVRFYKNGLFKKYFNYNTPESSLKKAKSKNLKLDHGKRNEIMNRAYKTYFISNNNSKDKILKKRNFSLFSNSKTEFKTDYSSLPTASFTSRNFYKNKNYFNSNLYSKTEAYGYKGTNLKDPSFSNVGIIRGFMKDIDNKRKNNYKNYCLKLSELKNNWLTDNIISLIRLDEKTKKFTNYLLGLYSNSYNIYRLYLKKNINREFDIDDDLLFEIKNLKIQINNLTIKIQKMLIRLSIFVEIRDFLVELKEFSSCPLGTSYSQLSELKNKLMENIKNNEEQTNFNLFLLSKNDMGIDIFINKYKESYMGNKNNANYHKNIFTTIEEFSIIPDKLDSNIKKLLWEQNLLERDIDILKSELYEAMENSKNEKIFQEKMKIQCNILIKTLSHFKTENEHLKYKLQLVKKKSKLEKYEKFNKNIGIKIFQLFNNFNKNEFITEEENDLLSKAFSTSTIKYLMRCLSIIENHIIYLVNFKNKVIYKDPKLKKKFELDSKIAATIRRKKQEAQDTFIKNKKTIEKINKIKFYSLKKDYYSLNRVILLNKEKKLAKKKEKEKEKKNKRPSIELWMENY